MKKKLYEFCHDSVKNPTGNDWNQEKMTKAQALKEFYRWVEDMWDTWDESGEEWVASCWETDGSTLATVYSWYERHPL